ncbi:MAG: CoA transferase [Acidobacteria bacterium]|nr:CoA transferase [Acidobacteriota bacterium]
MADQHDPAERDAPQPLDGVRVLDLSGAIGAYGTRLLADLGADVVKVEPPTGDALRRRPPFKDGVTAPEASLVFACHNANKRGITLDATSDAALPLLAELGATADAVVISPSRRAPLAGWDRDAMTLAWARPDAIVTAVTPFGLTGPMRDHRATAFTSYAAGGGMHRTGAPDGPPVAVPGQQQWDEAGIYAALGTMAGLRARPTAGGQVLDLAVHEVAASKDFLLERYDMTGLGGWGRSILVGYPPTGAWACADGELQVSTHQLYHWEAFLAMLGHPEELAEPSLSDPLVRRDLFEGLRDTIADLLAKESRLDLFERGQGFGLPCNPSNTPGEFVRDDHARARGMFVSTTNEGTGTVELPWGSFKSSPALLTLRRPAPTLGQHNRELYLDELGHAAAELDGWKQAGLV